MLDDIPNYSTGTIHIDTQLVNMPEQLALYKEIPRTISGLLLQWVVTWALPEIYVDLIRERKKKGLPTFIISSWYEKQGVWLWNYESIVRNQDVWWIYLEWVNLKDIACVCETLDEFIRQWKHWPILEKAMISHFWKNISSTDEANQSVVDIL